MLPQFTAVCKSSSFHLRNIFRICKFLSYDTCKTLIHAFVTARIDYCNSLLYGQPKCILKHLQSVLNSAARLIHEGLEGYFRDSGFDQNTVRESGKR